MEDSKREIKESKKPKEVILNDPKMNVNLILNELRITGRDRRVIEKTCKDIILKKSEWVTLLKNKGYDIKI